MLDFNEEIQKFKPSLEVDQAEEAIFANDLTDLTDILETIVNNNSQGESR